MTPEESASSDKLAAEAQTHQGSGWRARKRGFGAVIGTAAGRPLGALRELRHRSLNNWHLKVAAFALAVVFWFFVSMDDTVISQRTVRAPLNVEGLAANQLTSGVPETVEVRLSGPAHRISSLSPNGVDAVLDLRGTSGAFEQTVRVFPPQGISLLGVQPSEVVGSVETQIEQAAPVEVALIGSVPDDLHIEVRTLPSAVVVSGPEGRVNEVARVLAPVRPGELTETVAVYAVDAAGVPVPEVSVQPEQVAVTLSEAPVLHTRRVPVVLRPLVPGRWRVLSATLSQPEALLAGPEADLAGLERVQATAALTGSELTPGVHTLVLSLELPEGVSALEVPQLEVELAAPEPQASAAEAEAGAEPDAEPDERSP